MPIYPFVQLHIDGAWRDGLERHTVAVRNPATQDVVGHVARATIADLEMALEAAEKGFAVWRNTPAFTRAGIMRRAANHLRERKDMIAQLMTTEQGKPLAQSALEVSNAADTVDWFAEEARRAYGQTIPSRNAKVTQMTLKEPVGPVAAFSPWNFPLNQLVRKLAAALAAGCSIIVKPPNETPASPAELIRAFVDAGVAPGVIGLVYGEPAEISEFLIANPVIRKVSFTGSTTVGKHLASLAGRHMKRVTMELGGHAPVLIFDDADIDAAVQDTAAAKIRNAGQVCIAPTRFLVQQGVADRFLELFVKQMKDVQIGKGTEPGVTMGPLANERRIPVLEGMIEDAVAKGARIECGGKRVGNRGFFFSPTVLSNVSPNSTAMNEEPFGPIALVNRFTETDEAIAEANRLPYGLAAYAFTKSATTVSALRRVEAGMLAINHIALGMPELPFGGVQDSGFGTEGGSEAIDAYLETRLVTLLA